MTSESTSVTSSQEFDLNTLIEAFQVLSREIVLDRLIQAVMRIIIINAGADKALLLLPSQDKMWVRAEIAGSAHEATLLDNQTIENKSDELCVSAIHYVDRSHEPLLLNNATQEGHFTQDPYILSQKPQSIAIFPLIQQNKLMGIVYLENHVTKGAFTENRVRLLSILSTQIAISIANAEFYAELESKVQERTRDLQETMQKLKEMQQQLILQEKLKEREIMKHKLGKYVPNPKVLEIVLERGMTLGGEQKEVTILFCDLRNFTTLSETLTPEQIVEILNRFFTEMVAIVNRHQGIVDKFIGDAFMAVFGAFEMDVKHAQHAVEAAIEIQKKMRESFQEQKDKNVPLRAGCGINTGVVLMGNIGSEERYEYTAIGDNVNVASRLESLTKTMECDILITESTYKYLDHSIPVKHQGKVKVKGKKDELQIYEVLHD